MVCPHHLFSTPLRLELWYFWCDQELYMTRLVLFDKHLIMRNDYPWGGRGWRTFLEKPHTVFMTLFEEFMGCPTYHHYARLSATAHFNACCAYCGVIKNNL